MNGESLCQAFVSKEILPWPASKLLCQCGARYDEASDTSCTTGHKDGFQLKQAKYRFLLPRVEYLHVGHQISSNGIRPLQTKIEAILKAPVPGNIQKLRSFLSLINYYGKFIPNLSILLQPLNAWLQAGTKWSWSIKCEKPFQEAKKQIQKY